MRLDRPHQGSVRDGELRVERLVGLAHLRQAVLTVLCDRVPQLRNPGAHLAADRLGDGDGVMHAAQDRDARSAFPLRSPRMAGLVMSESAGHRVAELRLRSGVTRVHWPVRRDSAPPLLIWFATGGAVAELVADCGVVVIS